MSIIAFHGCSFTWGQGLQYYYLKEELGYTDKEILELSTNQKDLVDIKNINFEQFPKKIDDYRKAHHFPNLVSSHFDVPHILSLQGNGGDNESIIKRIENPHHFHLDCVQTHIVQITSPTRGSHEYTSQWHEDNWPAIDKDPMNFMWMIKAQVETIKDMLEEMNQFGQNILFLCWFKEHAEYIKEKYPKQLIQIEYKRSIYDSFDVFTDNDDFKGEGMNIRDDFKGSDDTHFSRKAHKLVAKAIIKKIKKEKIKFNTIKV